MFARCEEKAVSFQPSAISLAPEAVSLAPEAISRKEGGLPDWLAETAARGASDLLLIAGHPPIVWAGGQWSPLADRPLDAEQVAVSVDSLLSDSRRAELQTQQDVDFALPVAGVGRFRVNIHYQRGTLAAAFRAIPLRVPPFEGLGLPPQVLGFAEYPSGLVLVTGCTGQGKSTTLAAIVDHMNRTRRDHVITIEDPIEFLFESGTCLIEQREIGQDSPSFGSALRHVLRQRPDIILVGELRDLETISTALTAAETGHLVLASLHTASAAQTIARIIDVFPAAQQPQVRTQLAASLRAIVCQRLVRDRLNEALVPATEILVGTQAIARAIRDNETHLVYGMIETGRQRGMQTLEQSLVELVRDGRVESKDALAAAADPARLARQLGLPVAEPVGG